MAPKRGFTLIELLIVVAIIAILAAIAIPNFLEAQVRSKYARCQADMRTLTLAIEAYMTDNNRYIPARVCPLGPTTYITIGATGKASNRFLILTTPIAYMTTIPKDGFNLISASTDPRFPSFYDTFDYWDDHSSIPEGRGATSGAVWRLAGVGPDQMAAFGGAWVGTTYTVKGFPVNEVGVDYDPTNGTVSYGDVVRVGAPSNFGTAIPRFDRSHGRLMINE
jgi:prepilin-type N-terminal cleavage/methylation domain-containing protein